MSGSESSFPSGAGGAAPDGAAPLNLSVHSLPRAEVPRDDARTRRGRWQMLGLLLVCAAPVVASYLAYFGLRPAAKTNYGDFIVPARPVPAGLTLFDPAGVAVAPPSLRDQWLLVVVAPAACDTACQRRLWVQRQLHESLGREKDRVEKIWLVDDAAAPSDATIEAIGADPRRPPAGFSPARILRVERSALAAWLQPAAGHALEDHLYVVDPRGDWMMRMPADADPAKVKRDIEKLLRASAGWDKPGR